MKREKSVKAWHWVKSDGGVWITGCGGLEVYPGQTLVHEGEVEIGRSGLHASRRIIDVLDYAKGSVICRVELRGIVDESSDKFVARERTLLWGFDAEEVLWDWARRCALSVLHLWEAPDVVRDYLITGDKRLRCAARVASRAANRYATWASVYASYETWDASWTVWYARSAARYAAQEAAREASREAARSAARFVRFTRATQDRWLMTRVFSEARRRGLI